MLQGALDHVYVRNAAYLNSDLIYRKHITIFLDFIRLLLIFLALFSCTSHLAFAFLLISLCFVFPLLTRDLAPVHGRRLVSAPRLRRLPAERPLTARLIGPLRPVFGSSAAEAITSNF